MIPAIMLCTISVVCLLARYWDRKQVLKQVPRLKQRIMQQLIKAGGTPVRRYGLAFQITSNQWVLRAFDIALAQLTKEGHVQVEDSEPLPFVEDEAWDKTVLEYVTMTTKGYRTYREPKKAA